MKWEDYGEIAEALNKLYPKRNPVVMEDSELIEKVIALPGFEGGEKPEKDMYLPFISNKWILIRERGTTIVDDSPFV